MRGKQRRRRVRERFSHCYLMGGWARRLWTACCTELTVFHSPNTCLSLNNMDLGLSNDHRQQNTLLASIDSCQLWTHSHARRVTPRISTLSFLADDVLSRVDRNVSNKCECFLLEAESEQAKIALPMHNQHIFREAKHFKSPAEVFMRIPHSWALNRFVL